MTQMILNGPDDSPKLHIPLGNLDPLWFLGPPEPGLKLTSRSLHDGGWYRQRAVEFYESNVYKLIVNCATGCFFTSAAGARSNRPGKSLVFVKLPESGEVIKLPGR